MKTPIGVTIINPDDLDHILDSAVHYACGRGTYADDAVLDVLERNRMRLRKATALELADWIERREPHNSRWMNMAWLLRRGPWDKPGPLEADGVDRRILFACAFRHDIDSTDPRLPRLWETYTKRYPQVLFTDWWNRVSARDLVWENLIPLDEPLGDVQDVGGRMQPTDDRWVGLFRILRDTPEYGKGKA